MAEYGVQTWDASGNVNNRGAVATLNTSQNIIVVPSIYRPSHCRPSDRAGLPVIDLDSIVFIRFYGKPAIV